MAKKCSVCNGKLGLLLQYELVDGTMCDRCFTALLKKTRDIYSENGVKFKSATYQTNDVKYCLEHSADELDDYVENLVRKSIEIENQTYLKKAEEDLQSRCCICGTDSLIKAFSAKTSDGRLVCPTCMDYVPTIEPAALKQTKEYIKTHTSAFFCDNISGYLEMYPSNVANLRMAVNKKTGYISVSSEVYPIRSIEKIETETGEYEIIHQNNGHPIARAIVGGMFFGTAGAVVGAVTAHKTFETKTKSKGTPEVSVLTREADGRLKKRTYYCSDRAQALQFEDSFRQIIDFIDYTDVKDKKVSDSASSSASQTDYADLIKLKELLDAGILTQEEFDTKKRQILKL